MQPHSLVNVTVMNKPTFSKKFLSGNSSVTLCLNLPFMNILLNSFHYHYVKPGKGYHRTIYLPFDL